MFDHSITTFRVQVPLTSLTVAILGPLLEMPPPGLPPDELFDPAFDRGGARPVFLPGPLVLN